MNISGVFRYIPLRTLILFFGIALFTIPAHVHAAADSIILSEIQIEGVDKEGKTQNEDEFVELYNTTNETLSLKNYKLVRKTKTSTTHLSLRSSFKETDVIPGKSFYLLVNKDAPASLLTIKDNEFISSGTLAINNSLALLDKEDVPLDSIAWGTGKIFNEETLTVENLPSNNNLVRDIKTLLWSTTATPSPTNKDGVTVAVTPPLPPENPPPLDPVPPTMPPDLPLPISIRFNEIFPDPSAKSDAGEFIELYNFGTESSDISGWEILDATAVKKKSDGKTLSKSDRLVFPNATIMNAGGYLIATDANPWFSLTLNNTNETLSLFDKNGTLVDSLHFDKSKEDISLNHTPGGWRGGTPTPGAINALNTLPETNEKVPKKGYRDVAVFFKAHGRDADGDVLKYTWNFGDGHKSFKKEPSHKYELNGTYQVTLTTTDGSDDVTEIFTLKIESFPEADVRITSFVPNPSGKDSDHEYLILENREKKSVNLKGYSIATGWKKLINHPVREDFVIAPKSEAKLSRNFSLFTLPNQKGKIELRGPGGKTLQKIKYKLETSVTEDALYFKKKGQSWEWQEMKATTDTDAVELPESEENEETGAEPESLSAPSTEPPSETAEDVPLTLSETKKVSFLPLLNYGTQVTLPENIQLTFEDPSVVAYSPAREHYAVTFAKEVLVGINARINNLQNEE